MVLAFFLVLGLFFFGTRRTSSQIVSYILDIVTQNIPMFTCIYNISYWTRWEPKHLARSSESLVIRVIQNKSSYSFVINIRELELNEAHRYTIGCIRKFYSGSDMILREKLFCNCFCRYVTKMINKAHIWNLRGQRQDLYRTVSRLSKEKNQFENGRVKSFC